MSSTTHIRAHLTSVAVESPLRSALRDAAAARTKVSAPGVTGAEYEGETIGLITSILLKGRPVNRALRSALADLLRIHPDERFAVLQGRSREGSNSRAGSALNALDEVIRCLSETIAVEEAVSLRTRA